MELLELLFDILGEFFSAIEDSVRASSADNSETKRRIGIIAVVGVILCAIGYIVCDLLS